MTSIFVQFMADMLDWCEAVSTLITPAVCVVANRVIGFVDSVTISIGFFNIYIYVIGI